MSSDFDDTCGVTLSTGDKRPYVVQIHDQLLARIKAGELRPGFCIPSLRRMAAACGVSLGIVKQAVNTLCIEGHLRSHPGRGVFVAEPREKQRMVALVLPALDDVEMPRLIRGVKRGLMGSGRKLLIQAADYDFSQEGELVQALNPDLVAGAIIHPPPLSSFAAPLEELAGRGLPVVLLDAIQPGLAADSVGIDRRQAGRLAFQALLEAGHRRIGVVDHNADSLGHREFHRGADEILAAAGLSFHELPRIATEVTDLNPVEPWGNGQRAGTTLLREHPDLTALVGTNNNLGLGAYRAIRAAGLSLPRDCSLVVVSDLPAFQSLECPVTVVASPTEDHGERAARRLLARLAGEPGVPAAELLTPVLVRRASVAPPRS